MKVCDLNFIKERYRQHKVYSSVEEDCNEGSENGNGCLEESSWALFGQAGLGRGDGSVEGSCVVSPLSGEGSSSVNAGSVDLTAWDGGVGEEWEWSGGAADWGAVECGLAEVSGVAWSSDLSGEWCQWGESVGLGGWVNNSSRSGCVESSELSWETESSCVSSSSINSETNTLRCLVNAVWISSALCVLGWVGSRAALELSEEVVGESLSDESEGNEDEDLEVHSY